MSSKLFTRYRFSEWLKVILDTRQASLLCIFLTYVNKIAIAWIYTDLEDDKSLYLLLSDSALKGKLFLEPVNFYNGAVTEYIFNPAVVSPLYSCLAVPVLWMTKSFVTTSFVIDIISWGVFLTGLYSSALILLKQRWIANVFILCTGFFLYPHELASTPKDTLAVGLMLWGCICTCDLLRYNSLQLPKVFIASVIFILLALAKLLYAPLALLFVFIMYAHAYRSKNRKQWYNAHISLLINTTALFFFYLFIAYQKSQASRLGINSDGTEFTVGLFPENMLQTFPFIASSFINTNFMGVQLERLFGISFASVTKGFQIFDLFVIGLSVLLTFRYYKEVKQLPVLFRLLGLFSIALVAMVCFMSLTHKAVIFRLSGASYTYVQEARSFLPVIITIQLLIFFVVFRTSLHPAVRFMLLAFFLFEALHGVYFTYRQIADRHRLIAAKQISSPSEKVINELLSLEKEHRKIRLLTTENSLRRLAIVKGINSYSLPNECIQEVDIKYPTIVAVLKSDTTAIRSCLLNHQLYLVDKTPPFSLGFFHLSK